MAARRGTATPIKAYRGSVQAVKAYRGAVQVWPAGGGTEFPYTFPFNLGEGGGTGPEPAVQTTTVLSITPSTITEGDSTTLTATVSPSGAVGSVAFTVDGGSPIVVAVSGGVASTQVMVPDDGTYGVSAVFTPTSEEDFTTSSDTDTLVVEAAPALPVLYVTGTDWWESETQVISALSTYGLTKNTVTTFPFFIDCSGATDLSGLFAECPNLVHAPAISDTSHILYMDSMYELSSSIQTIPDMNTGSASSINDMFSGCTALTDGNVRLIGKKSGVTTSRAILNSGLTRVPFFDVNGNPI